MAPEVSVILVNFNGREFLDDCLASLYAQSLPRERFEIVLVDNASSDGSVDHVRVRWPDVRVVALDTNTGFAGGNNAGVREATGTTVALINVDARAHPDWLKTGLVALHSALDVGAVASKIVGFDGKTIDFAGGALSFYGHGFKVGGDEPDTGQYDRPGETLFPSGCAMFVPRKLYLDSGGFDEDYFAFFEDVDLGWRLWLLGYRVLYEPASLVYHRHHGTFGRFGYPRERYLLERNALYTVLKNYEKENVDRMLGASIWLTIERGMHFTALDASQYDFRSQTPWSDEDERIPRLAAAHLLAISDVSKNLPRLMEKRERVQEHRKRTDREIAPLFKHALLPNDSAPGFLRAFEHVVGEFGIRDVFRPQSHVLVITADTVSKKMAGPAIRAWEMARHLGRRNAVRLLVRSRSDVVPDGFELDVLSKRSLREHLKWADVVVFQGFVLFLYPEVAKSGKVLVADIYDPFHLENLEMMREDEAGRRIAIAQSDLTVINDQLKMCDYFICASAKQRDFWLGQLTALGRVNPHTYDADPNLQQLVDVVPFGISSEPPEHRRNVLKGVVPGIGPEDKVLLWGGGIYNWFDPLTVIRAVDQVRRTHPEVKLFFMGMAHPNPDVPQMHMAVEAQRLAAELGVEGTHVFFNRDWVPYEERASYLLESDVGVSCHHLHVETTFSYRTRVLDYFWANLPVIVTRGDALSELVEQHELGLTIDAGDVQGFANAIVRMLEDASLMENFRQNIEKLKPDLTWSKVLEPLDAFCSSPRRAPDKVETIAFGVEPRSRRSPVHLLRRALHYWRAGGWGVLKMHLRNFVLRKRLPGA